MAVSLPSWELGKTLISTRPCVAAFTSSAKPVAATCQLCAGGRTWPSLNVAAWAAAAPRAIAAASNITTALTLFILVPPCSIRSLADTPDSLDGFRESSLVHRQRRTEVALTARAETRTGRHDHARVIQEPPGELYGGLRVPDPAPGVEGCVGSLRRVAEAD